MNSEDVVSVLRPVCGDPHRPSNLKRVLLDLMNKVNSVLVKRKSRKVRMDPGRDPTEGFFQV